MPTVELYGQARLLAGVASLQVPGQTLREVLSALARRQPALVGPVLEPDGRPTAAYTLNLNGRQFCTDLNQAVVEQDELLVISSLSGG